MEVTHIKKSKSLKLNAALNVIKQCCVIIFPLITFPYISRVLGSDGYGKYSFSSSVLSYFRLIAGLGIATYAVREGAKIRDDRMSLENFSSQIFSINIVSTIVSMVSMIIVIYTVSKLHGYAIYIYALSIGVWLTTIGVDWINSIYEDYFYITVRYIIFEIIALILMFLFVKSKSDALNYCIITTLAGYGGNLANIFYVRKYAHIRFTFHMNLKKHIIPLLILLANSFAITIYVNSDIVMLGFYTSDTQVGVYSFISKLYDILKQLINAIVIVSIPRVAYYLKNQNVKYSKEVRKILDALTMAILPITIGLFMMSRTIIKIVGGNQYISGNNSLKVLSFAIIFAIYSSLYTNCILIVNRREKYCLVSTVISALMNIVMNFVLIPIFGILAAAITTLIAESLNCIIQIRFAKDIFKFDFLFSIKSNWQCVVGTIEIFIICFITNLLINNDVLRLGVSIILSGILYICTLIVLKYELFEELVHGIMKTKE